MPHHSRPSTVRQAVAGHADITLPQLLGALGLPDAPLTHGEHARFVRELADCDFLPTSRRRGVYLVYRRVAPWVALDLARPAYHLRELARGVAPVLDPIRAAALGVPLGADAPVLTLAEAAQLLDVSSQGAQTPERREAGKGLRGSERGSMTVASLVARAAAYEVDLEIRVRPRPR